MRRTRRMPAIAAGEVELGAWCAVCRLPTRLRLPVHAVDPSGPRLGVIEICPGCGTGHDRPSVGVAPPEPLSPTARLPLRVRAARRIHARWCRRRGAPSRECAYGECEWPGLWRHALELPGDDGTWRYVFCRRSHRTAWAAENRLRPELHSGTSPV